MALDFDSARIANPYLTDAHEAWRDQVRRFVDEFLMPNAESWDEEGQIPDWLWPRAAEVGLLGLGYPEQFGGILDGTDVWFHNIVNEELARVGVGGVAATLMVHNIGLPPVANFAEPAIASAVVPAVISGDANISLGITEPGGGSDVASLKTTAVRDGDAYVVNGSKTLITGGMRANWLTTAVRTGDAGRGGVSMLLISADSDGVSRTPLDKKQGWWASDTATIYFDNVCVPAEHLIGKENQGFQVIMHNFNHERLAMSVGMEAMARVCLEEAVNWARERHTFGQRLADHQVIRHKIAMMKQRINATQGYLQYVTRAVDDGSVDAGDMALLKVQASETVEFCAREAMQILGGAGYLRGNRVERIYREVRVNAIGGGSEEIMRDLAARQYRL